MMRGARRTPPRALLARSLLPLMLLLALLLPAPAARAAEEILDFSSEVRVQRDGALLVTEIIRVRAEGRRIRRGIFRDFPLHFRRVDGGIGQAGFKVLKVLRDGQPENWFVEYPESGVARIYIGRKEVMLPPGTYTYAITYRTTRQLRFFDDYDELYWNVTGNFWVFPIRQARVEVRLPSPARILRHALYTGRLGERGRDARVVRVEAGRFVAETSRVLLPGEGFTIAIAFPKGVVAEPSALRRWLWRLWDMAGLVWLTAGTGALTLYFLWAWWRHGRDPKPGVIIPRWEPPQGVSPAIASGLSQAALQMGEDGMRPFIAALVSLATKGYVSLGRDEAGRLSIRRLKPADDSLPPGERVIMERLLGSAESLTLDKATGRALQQVLGEFRAAIEAEYKEALLRGNDLYFIIGIGILALTGIGLLVLAWLGAPLAAQLLMVQLLVLLPVAMVGNQLLDLLAVRRRVKALIGSILPLPTLVIFIVLAWFVIKDVMGGMGSKLSWLAVLLFSLPLLLIVFRRLLPRPTRAGRKVLDELAGLRMFIETAEQRRLNQPGPDGAPPMSVPLFEKLLPWAIALGLEEPWTRALNKWLATAAAAGAATAAHYSPSWYRGISGRDIGESLGSDISSSLAESIAEAMPSQSSSGSFGGGGAGGGGGGGGGGGW